MEGVCGEYLYHTLFCTAAGEEDKAEVTTSGADRLKDSAKLELN